MNPERFAYENETKKILPKTKGDVETKFDKCGYS